MIDMERHRKSARQITFDLANELLAKNESSNLDIEVNAKLSVIESIAYRMGWTELYNKIKFRDRKNPWWVDK